MVGEPSQCTTCGAAIDRGRLGGLCGHCLRNDLGSELEAEADLAASVEAVIVGDYELLEAIAHGGAGRVYRARQRSLNREVALKMLLSGQFADKREVRRLRTEAEAAARLDHPNIVPIYEVGEHEGRVFYSMRLITGGTLEKKVAAAPNHRLDGQTAAGLMITVARAVEYAHRSGVLHCDLKPANILLTEAGEPCITDFGLARDLNQTLQHSGREWFGTLGYMAPEQAAEGGAKLTPSTDVFALGATLYFTLAGTPPFAGETLMQTMEAIARGDPPRFARLGVTVDPGLEAICRRALARECRQRQASAGDLANDLEAWLRQTQVASPWKSLPPYSRRAWLGAGAGVFALAGMGARWSSRHWPPGRASTGDTAAAARKRTELIAQMAKVRLQDVVQWLPLPESATAVTVDSQFKFYAFVQKERELTVLRVDTGTVSLHVPDCGMPVAAVVIEPRASLVVCRDAQQNLAVWRLEKAQPELRLGPDSGGPPVVDFCFIMGARFLQTADPKGNLRRYFCDSLREEQSLTTAPLPERLVDQGPWLLTIHADRIYRIDLERKLTIQPTRGRRPGRLGRCLGLSADGTALALPFLEGWVEVVDYRSNNTCLLPHPGAVERVCFHPHSHLLATDCADQQVRIWDGFHRQLLAQCDGESALGFSPDGGRLAVLRMGGIALVKFAQPQALRRLTVSLQHESVGEGLVFNPSGNLLLGVSGNEAVLWMLPYGWRPMFYSHVSGVGFVNDTVVARIEGTIGFSHLVMRGQGEASLKIDTRPLIKPIPGTYRRLVMRPGDGELLAHDDQGRPTLLRIDTGEILRRFEGQARPGGAAISPDGMWIACGFEGEDPRQHGNVTVWRKADGTVAARLPATSCGVVFSADSRQLLVGTAERHRIFSTESWTEERVHEVEEADGQPSPGAYSGDGTLLCLRVRPALLRVSHYDMGAPLFELAASQGATIRQIAFSSNGRYLAAGTSAGVDLWDFMHLRPRLADAGLPLPEPRPS